MAPTFSIDRINEAIQNTVFHDKLHHFASTDSTNTRALIDAQAGAAAGQVYIADEQTTGRGRAGHAWHSEPERGLYLTALVRPAMPADDVLKISFAAAIAAALAIADTTGLQIDLRWPNDLVAPCGGPGIDLRSRKLGGILSESASTSQGRVRHAAIGIGINLNQVEFPPEFAATATSLRAECGSEVSREAVATALLRHLHAELLRLETAGGAVETLQRFAMFSTWVNGKRVSVAEGYGYTGTTTGLTPEGLLKVRCDNGQERVVRHGGVREL